MERVTWHAVDGRGRDLATGRSPCPPGWPTPAAALAAAPVVTWPLRVTAGNGHQMTLAGALGPGGDRVEALLDALMRRPARLADADIDGLARCTPAGRVTLPVQRVTLAAGVEAASRTDPSWLARVERRRAAAREALEAAGRSAEAEAAVHVAVLLATERLDPADDGDVEAHVASGAQLWLIAGAVVSALSGADPDPFGPWASLIVAGWWPVGPSRGHLVVSATGPSGRLERATA